MPKHKQIRALTANERLFIKMVFGDNKTPEAAADQIYQTKDARNLGLKILQRCTVQHNVSRMLDEFGLTDRMLVKMMVHQLTATKKQFNKATLEFEDVPDNQVRTRALDRILRIKGFFNKSVELPDDYRLSEGDMVDEDVEEQNAKEAEKFRQLQVVT